MVSSDFASIYKAVRERVSKASFPNLFMATQITIDEAYPMYVRVEEGEAEVAPYEYNDASFYIDAKTADFCRILNGKKSVYDGIADGSVRINGDAQRAIIFVKAVFG